MQNPLIKQFSFETPVDAILHVLKYWGTCQLSSGIEHTYKVPVLAVLTFLISYLLFWRITRLYDATLVLVLRFMIKEHILSGL